MGEYKRTVEEAAITAGRRGTEVVSRARPRQKNITKIIREKDFLVWDR